MTYVVRWSVEAVRETTRVEATAVDPVSVRRAADHIDYTLRRTPGDMGESREPGYRVWYGDVIGVRYYIDDVAYRVDVLAVAPARRHRS